MKSKLIKAISVSAAALATAALATGSVFAAVTAPTVKEIASPDEAVKAVLNKDVAAQDVEAVVADNSQITVFEVPEDMKLPFSKGIVLSTGSANNVFNQIDTYFEPGVFYGAGNEYLDQINKTKGIDGKTYDAASLMFSLMPTSN